ncbi:hypothetical protein [Bergeyella porcorum]|uniref:hypothetical protein n=1 Tax=Bergeyella porcorum TaxID=1735111 RepID=UPI002E214ED2
MRWQYDGRKAYFTLLLIVFLIILQRFYYKFKNEIFVIFLQGSSKVAPRFV